MHTLALQMTGREQLKLFVRCIVAAILFYSGINALYRFVVRRNRAVVLMYHRVVDIAELNWSYLQPGMYVTKETFEMQMEYLSRRYHVVALEEFIEILKGGYRIKRNTCVISFDDGWKETYTYAFPILKKYNLPAAVFLVSGSVGRNQWLWPENVAYFFTRYFQIVQFKEHQPTIYSALQRVGFFRLVSNEGLTSAQKIEVMIETMKDLEEGEREKMICDMEEWLKDHREAECPKPLTLNWGEITEMGKSNITFGSHTKSHTILTKVSKTKALEEIVESKQEIERRLLKSCTVFCYPNGDNDDEIRKLVRQHYACAFTTQSGFVKPSDNLYGLKRIAIHNDIAFLRALFACRLTGILS